MRDPERRTEADSAAIPRHRAAIALMLAAAAFCVVAALGLARLTGRDAHRVTGRLLGAGALFAVAATLLLATRELRHEEPPPPDDARWLRR
jgi:hypothetical protein